VLALKRAQNDHQITGSELEKTRNSTVKNYIDNKVGLIANLEEEVALAEKNLKAYPELRELGFVSDVEVLREKAKRNKALHTIKMTRADLDAYKKYDQASLISIKQLAVDEAFVNIEKTKVQTVADLSDANSSISTQEKTLNLEKERLEDLREQMANTRIYAPEPGVVVYYAPRHWEKQELVSNGSNVRRGQNLIKLPKDKSLKVDLSVPQAMRAQLKLSMKAWVQVENGEPLPGTLSMLSKIVDSNRRGHTQKSYFKGEITIDREEFPDSVSEGMTVTVEIQVINLIGENQRIKVPNQCVISQMIDDVAETGCWVLNPDTNELSWRPVTIEYNDENFVAIKDETDPGRGLREDELVLLAPLTQADNMNLEEGVTNKGKVKLGEPKLDEDAKEKSSTGG
jgi:multidrug efflux pump subunit AcrA (membrane-fusion protein)